MPIVLMGCVIILRLGHRKERDKRITTHVALVARAFGAKKMVLCGEEDKSVIESVRKIVERWGGDFEIEYCKNYLAFLKKFSGLKVHLTMYGIDFREKISEIQNALKEKNIIVIVGAEKVPGEIYGIADLNLAVTHQPHSEVAALAVFLYELFGRRFPEKFENAKIEVVPCARGKKLKKL